MATLQQYYGVGGVDDDGQGTTSATQWMAQTFTPAETFTITYAQLYLLRNGTPGTMTVGIYATSDGKPTGDALIEGTYESNLVNTSAEWIEVSFGDGVQLTISVMYAIVVSTPAAYIAWRVDSSTPSYAGGHSCTSLDTGSSWTTYTSIDRLFRTYSGTGSTFTPIDKIYSKKLVAVANNEVWYESSAGVMSELAAATGTIDVTLPLSIFEAFQKAFIVNGANKKVVDFGNTKIATDAVGSHYPDRGNILTGGTSGAKMIVDYIDSLTGATTIYGFRTTEDTFTNGETVTGTDDDDNAISFATNAAEVAPPHWYDWTSYGDSATYGELPSKVVAGCLYRGRAVLTRNSDAPHQWYMSRQNNPWNFNYSATDAQAAVAGGTGDVGELGDVMVVVVPYKDDYAIYGGVNSMWLLRGDPMQGGSLDELDLTQGIVSSLAWCFDGKNNFYFLGTNGLCRVGPDFGLPENLTLERYPKFVDDLALDESLHRVVLSYDRTRHGIIISKTTLADGTNEDYWYDLQTEGLCPEDYPEEAAFYCSHRYDAEDPDYRELLFGCFDGYIRFFDDSAKNDDAGTGGDEEIDSYVTFGPQPMSSDPDKTGKLQSFIVVAAGGASNGSQTDSNNIYYKIFTADIAEEIIEKLSANDSPNFSGTITAPGRQKGGRDRRKAKGAFLGIRLGNNTIDETWAFEKWIGHISPSGRIK